MRHFEAIDMLLKQRSIRITLQRRLIGDVLKAVPSALTPLEIHTHLAKHNSLVDLVTVYRTLALFEKKHIAHRHPSSGGYLLCTIPEEKGHHGFLTCTSCKRTSEFHEPKFCELEETIARRAKFFATNHISEIIGTCTRCRS